MTEQMTPEQQDANAQIVERLHLTAVLEKQVQMLEADSAQMRSQLAHALVIQQNNELYIDQLHAQIETLSANQQESSTDAEREY